MIKDHHRTIAFVAAMAGVMILKSLFFHAIVRSNNRRRLLLPVMLPGKICCRTAW